MKKRMHGFTLLELMATIAVAAVIFGLAIPFLADWIRDSRLGGFSNDFIAASHLARSEAIKRRTPVTICAVDADDASACSAAGQFRGWLVFVDTNGDWDRDIDEEILQSYAEPPAAVLVDSEEDRLISFADSGFARRNDDAIQRMVICDSRGNIRALGDLSTARLITIAPTGRPSISRDIDRISALDSALCPDPG